MLNGSGILDNSMGEAGGLNDDAESDDDVLEELLTPGGTASSANGHVSGIVVNFWYPPAKNCTCCKGYRQACDCVKTKGFLYCQLPECCPAAQSSGPKSGPTQGQGAGPRVSATPSQSGSTSSQNQNMPPHSFQGSNTPTSPGSHSQDPSAPENPDTWFPSSRNCQCCHGRKFGCTCVTSGRHTICQSKDCTATSGPGPRVSAAPSLPNVQPPVAQGSTASSVDFPPLVPSQPSLSGNPDTWFPNSRNCQCCQGKKFGCSCVTGGGHTVCQSKDCTGVAGPGPRVSAAPSYASVFNSNAQGSNSGSVNAFQGSASVSQPPALAPPLPFPQNSGGRQSGSMIIQSPSPGSGSSGGSRTPGIKFCHNDGYCSRSNCRFAHTYQSQDGEMCYYYNETAGGASPYQQHQQQNQYQHPQSQQSYQQNYQQNYSNQYGGSRYYKS